MRRYNILLTFLVLAFSVIVYSCSKSVDPSGNYSRSDENSSELEDLIEYSLTDIKGGDHPDREASLMALWYGNKLVSDIEVYFKFHDGLTLLREKFGDSIPEVAIPFSPPWVPSIIFVCLNDSANTEYEADNYTAWEYLNECLFVKNIGELLSFPDNHWYFMSFKGVLNPTILETYYDKK